jgi:hypothetical protein
MVYNKMSVLTDNEVSTLRDMIRQANIQKRPTEREFLGLLPANWWRTLGVQAQQEPLSQLGDEFTEEGELRARAEALARKLQIELQREEENEPDLLAKLREHLPSASQVALVTALIQGNIPQALLAFRRVQKEGPQKEKAAKRKKREKAKKFVDELKQTSERLKTQRTKGHKAKVAKPKKKKK